VRLRCDIFHHCCVQVQKFFVTLQVNLLNMLPEVDRTKDRLSEILEDRGLTFLFPLLRIQSELWKQLQADPNPTQFYKWIKENLDPSHHANAGFINALMTVLVKYITQVNYPVLRDQSNSGNRIWSFSIIATTLNFCIVLLPYWVMCLSTLISLAWQHYLL